VRPFTANAPAWQLRWFQPLRTSELYRDPKSHQTSEPAEVSAAPVELISSAVTNSPPWLQRWQGWHSSNEETQSENDRCWSSSGK